MSDPSPVALVCEKLTERIEKKQLQVPMLPEVAGKVVRLTQDPESESADLAKLIQSDQILAAKVMRIANSAAYSPNSSMVSLQQAITRLGMKLITEIALSASVNTELFNTPGFESHIAYEIKYSLLTGLWAKEVARACRKNVEAAFLTGLLHDIGRPVAIQTILEITRKLDINLSKADVFKIENKFQQEIGVSVVKKWEMPNSVCQSVEFFHNYSSPHSTQTQTMLVFAGALISHHFICEETEGEKAECMTIEEVKEQPVFGDLNLYPDQIDELLEKEEAINSTLEAMSE
ncbi:HDOD domain-containing protein [Agarilytica rhodophyticola]|uniref:HDOD domain-containing protein n=1 Tax=Agarilytica rhodophyticola TaxID=1737490 RepID=UPI000B347E93|nr:HDOD domain-containing protein [Agarilytica rhodophyticola]